MSRNMSRELGPCHYNGNEIVENSDPLRGVAGLAPDALDEWGYIFAAAPDLLEACIHLYDHIFSIQVGSISKATWDILDEASAAIAKALGES